MNKKAITGIFIVLILFTGCFFMAKNSAKRNLSEEPKTATIDSNIKNNSILYKVSNGKVYSISVDGTIKKLYENQADYLELMHNQKNDRIISVAKTGEGYKNNLKISIDVKELSGKIYNIIKLDNIDIKDISISHDGKFVSYTIIEESNLRTGSSIYSQKVIIASIDEKPIITELNNINADLLKVRSVDYYHIIGWSADNKELYAYSGNDIQAGVQNSGLYGINISTGQIRQVDNSTEIFVNAKLSPDGKKVAYVPYKYTSGSNGWTPFAPQTLKVLDLIELKKDVLITSDKSIGRISWSPNGSNVLFENEEFETVSIIDINTKTIQVINNITYFGDWLSNDNFCFIKVIKNDPTTNVDDTFVLKLINSTGASEKLLDSFTGIGGITFLGTSF